MQIDESTDPAEVYQHAVLAAAMCARLLAQYDIAELLRAIDRADALGPLLDPTLFMQKREAMGQDRELLEAAAGLAALGRRLGVAVMHPSKG